MANFKYLQLANILKSNILEGIYCPGQRIPTEPELSDTYSTSRYTVRQAVAQLEKEGFLKRVQGSGTYVTESFREQAVFYEEPSVQSNTIGLVTGDSQAYISPEIIRGVSNHLTEQGYLLSIAMTNGSYEKERTALELLLQNHPAGILLEPVKSGLFTVNYELYQEVAQKVPCLLIHSGAIGNCPALSLNDRKGAYLLTEYLIGLGHTKIGTFFCLDEYTGQSRYCGFLNALCQHGLTQDKAACVLTQRSQANDFFEPNGSLAIDRMLENVTAVFCHDDLLAHALIRYLTQKGIRVPEDVSVVSYDDSFYAVQELPLTCIAHPKAEYGSLAAQALLEMIQSHGKIDFSHYAIEPQLIIRSSAAAPNEKRLLTESAPATALAQEPYETTENKNGAAAN